MLKKITENVEIHQTLPDTPNLTSEELKKEWDKGSKIIKQAFNELIDELNNNLYPIGFRMFVNNDTDYTNHLGFIWKKVAKGKVLVGKDEDDADFNELGKIGGEKTHQHKYQVGSITSKNVVANAGVFATKNADSSIRGTSTTIATGQGINNNSELGSGSSWNYNDGYVVVSTGTTSLENSLQPYEVVNIWERIS